MQFKFLGTAAAEAIPARFCECDVCCFARKSRGKEIRRRASYLIDDDILVDFGPDSYWQEIEYNIDYLKLRHIIITHPHEDHLQPYELLYRTNGYSKVTQKINVYGGYKIFNTIMGCAAASKGLLTPEDLHFNPVTLQPGEPFKTDDLEIIPMAANHMPGGTPMIYIIRRQGKSVLICNDTGWPPPESMTTLKNQQVDMAVLDSTSGLLYPDTCNGHMGINTVKKLKNELLSCGAIKVHAPVFATHFSHNGGGTHEKLSAAYADAGISVAYDGLTVQI